MSHKVVMTIGTRDTLPMTNPSCLNQTFYNLIMNGCWVAASLSIVSFATK
jgi:hypothetical protein